MVRLSLFYYVICLTLVIASCSHDQKPSQIIRGDAIGTYYSVKYFSSDKDTEAIKMGFDSIVAKINRSLSKYQANSDISQINRGNETVVIDELFYKIFVLSKRVHRQTLGYFDPTFGGLKNAYGLGDSRPVSNMDSRKLDSMMQYVGFDKVKLSSYGTIQKEKPHIYLDFNSIAIGLLVDEFSNFLRVNKIYNFIVEIGGEVKTSEINLKKQEVGCGYRGL